MVALFGLLFCFIWEHIREELINFLVEINTEAHSIDFTFEIEENDELVVQRNDLVENYLTLK